MDISWWRDLVIVILEYLAAIVLVFISVLVVLLYRKLIPMMNSANEAIDKANTIADYTKKSDATYHAIWCGRPEGSTGCEFHHRFIP